MGYRGAVDGCPSLCWDRNFCYDIFYEKGMLVSDTSSSIWRVKRN
jgi:hypothetical protein